MRVLQSETHMLLQMLTPAYWVRAWETVPLLSTDAPQQMLLQ